MAINPFRIGDMSAPDQVKFPAANFSGIASLGASIGQYRDQQELGRIMAGSVDPRTGALDLQKAASALALSGRDPTRYLTAFTALQSEKRAEAAQQALQQHYRAIEGEAAANRALRQQEIEQGKTSEFQIEDPTGIGPPTRYRYSPSGGVQQIYPPPKPAAAPAPAATPSPRTEVPALAPAPVAFDPETAPPYRVAGPMMPPPQPGPLAEPAQAAPQPPRQPVATPQPVVPQPAPAAAAREAALQAFAQANGPDAAAIFRDVLDYKRGLPGEDKLKQRWITAARTIDPTFDPTKFEEQTKAGPQNNPFSSGGTQKTTEEQDKAAGFTNRMFRAEQVLRLPDVQAAAMDFGQNLVGNIPFVGNYGVTPAWQRNDQASRDFINAQLRRESGAAISMGEFANAYKQYLPRPNDSPQVLADKLANREAVIRAMAGSAGRGFTPSHLFDEKGDLVPNPKAPASRPVEPTNVVKPVANEAEANVLIRQGRDALKRDPNSRGIIEQRLRERGIRNPELMLGQ